MGQIKGKTGNPNGRPRGSKNRTTSEVKNLLLTFIGDNMPNLQAKYDKLDPAQQLAFIEKILKYIIPTQREEITDLEKLSDEQLDRIIDELKKGSHGKES